MIQGVVRRFGQVCVGFICASIVFLPPELSAQTLVSAQPLSTLIYQPQREAPAQVIALTDSQISAEISARVKRLTVSVGDTVAQSAVLAELDCSDYDLQARELDAQQQATQARLRFAAGQLQRARSLQKQKTVAQELVEQRQAERDALQAEQARLAVALARVERFRQHCQVLAPFAGTVIEKLADTGEYLIPGSPLFRLLAHGDIEVTAQIPSTALAGLQQSQDLKLQTPLGDYALRLRAVLPMIDRAAQTHAVRLRFMSDTAPAGSSGRLLWRLGPHLPETLLVQRDKQLGVFLALKGRAYFQVLPDALEGRPAAVRLRGAAGSADSDTASTLAADSLVITEGSRGLTNGDLITLQP